MKNTNAPRTSTEAQINANRENAKKSTGPRTAEGKAASSRNRLLHGLRANKHILLDEDPEDFLILLHDLYSRFRPVGDGEEKLVLRIAAGQWRLDRSLPMEAGIYRERLEVVAARDFARKRDHVNHKKNYELEPDTVPPPRPLPSEGDRLARAFNIDCDGPNSLAKLARYETSLERSIDRCLRQLERYQAARTVSAPEVEHPVPPAEAPTPAEPAATPSKSENYHLNPKNGGIVQLSAALFTLLSLLSLLGRTGLLACLDLGATKVGKTLGLRGSRGSAGAPKPPISLLHRICKPHVPTAGIVNN
jgi:hypothetical protein